MALVALPAPSARAKMIDALIPGVWPLPSGSQAGVDLYLERALASHHARRRTLVNDLCAMAEFLAHHRHALAFGALSAPDAEAIVATLEGAFSAPFRVFRDICFEGYLAHPIWRGGQGGEIWSAFGFKPVLRPEDIFGNAPAAAKLEVKAKVALVEIEAAPAPAREAYVGEVQDY